MRTGSKAPPKRSRKGRHVIQSGHDMLRPRSLQIHTQVFIAWPPNTSRHLPPPQVLLFLREKSEIGANMGSLETTRFKSGGYYYFSSALISERLGTRHSRRKFFSGYSFFGLTTKGRTEMTFRKIASFRKSAWLPIINLRTQVGISKLAKTCDYVGPALRERRRNFFQY